MWSGAISYMALAAVGAAAVLTTVRPVHALAAAGIAAAGAAILRWINDIPKATLFLIVALVPLDYISKFDGSLTFTKLLFPVGFGLLVVQWIVSGRRFVWCRQCTLVSLFGLAVVVSFLVNDPSDPFARRSMLRYAGILPLFFLTVNAIESERDVRALMLTVVISCAASAVVGGTGFAAAWLGIPQKIVSGLPVIPVGIRPGLASLSVAEHAGRLMGLSSVNPNTFASYLLTAAIFAFFFMVIDRRAWFRALMFGTLFALGLGVVLSLSRGVSLVSLLIVPLLLFALRRHISPWKAFLLFGAVVLCLLPLIPPQYYARIRMLVVDPELDVPLLMRHSFNKVALRLFAENPLLGLGPGGFSASFTSKEFRYIADTFGQWKMVHNLYLAVACHTGLVGLTLFGSVIWRAFSDLRFVASFNGNRDTVFTTRGAPVLEVVLAAFLINAFLLPAEHEKYMWVLFAVAAALARIHGRGAEPDSPAPEDAALWRSS